MRDMVPGNVLQSMWACRMCHGTRRVYIGDEDCPCPTCDGTGISLSSIVSVVVIGLLAGWLAFSYALPTQTVPVPTPVPTPGPIIASPLQDSG